MPSPRIVNGRRVRQAREARHWSQETLAKLLQDELGKNFDQSKVSRIEKGARIAPAERPAFLALLPGLVLLDDAETGDAEDLPSPSVASMQATTNPVSSLPGVYDADAIAEYIDVERGRIIAAFRCGDLAGRKVGRKWFATAQAVTDWLQPRPSEATSPAFATVTRRRAS